jgi:hypothetical protein
VPRKRKTSPRFRRLRRSGPGASISSTIRTTLAARCRRPSRARPSSQSRYREAGRVGQHHVGLGGLDADRGNENHPPQRRARIPGSTSCSSLTADSRFISRALFQSSSEIRSKGPDGGPGALTTRISIPHHRSPMSSVAAWMAAPSVRSSGMAGPFEAALSRAATATLAPSAANASAHARPNPRLPAVTRATRDLRPSSAVRQ